MPDNEILITTRFSSIGDDAVYARMNRLLENVNRVGAIFQNLGNYLGNEFVTNLGRVISSFDDIVRSVDAVGAALSRLPKFGAIGLITGGAALVGNAAGQAYNSATGTVSTEDRVRAYERLETALRNMPADQAANAFGTLKIELQGLSSAEQIAKINAFVDSLNKVPAAAEAANDALYRFISGQTNADIQNGPLVKNMLQFQQAQAANRAQSLLQSQRNFGQRFTGALGLGQSIQNLGAAVQGNQTALSMTLAQIERDAQQARISVAKQYTSDLAKIDEDYYANRSKVVEQFGVEAVRAEQDHQRDLQRMSQDHDKRIRRLAESRDALAIVDETDNYKTQRDRAEEDYQITTARRNEDLARQLADLERSYREQRNARINAFNQQLQDIADQAAVRRDQEKKATALIIQAILEEYRKAIDQLKITSPIDNAPHWNGPNNTANMTFNFGAVSDPYRVANIVHAEIARVFKAVR